MIKNRGNVSVNEATKKSDTTDAITSNVEFIRQYTVNSIYKGKNVNVTFFIIYDKNGNLIMKRKVDDDTLSNELNSEEIPFITDRSNMKYPVKKLREIAESNKNEFNPKQLEDRIDSKANRIEAEDYFSRNNRDNVVPPGVHHWIPYVVAKPGSNIFLTQDHRQNTGFEIRANMPEWGPRNTLLAHGYRYGNSTVIRMGAPYKYHFNHKFIILSSQRRDIHFVWNNGNLNFSRLINKKRNQYYKLPGGGNRNINTWASEGASDVVYGTQTATASSSMYRVPRMQLAKGMRIEIAELYFEYFGNQNIVIDDRWAHGGALFGITYYPNTVFDGWNGGPGDDSLMVRGRLEV